jgi:hypothetical protein
MAFRGVHLVQIAFVAHALDARLQRDHLIVTGHDRDGAKFQPLGKVHRGDGCLAGHRLQLFVQDHERQPRVSQGLPGAVQFGIAADEYADFVRRQPSV